MRGLLCKSVVSGLIGLLFTGAGSLQASVNPFKKSKNHTFGADVSWYEDSGSVMKSGSVRDGSDTNYYHLNINKSRVLLRLGKNDPSGKVKNTRKLDALAITDVLADGKRLARFSYCLKNQQKPGRKLKQNSLVANNACINAGGGGDFLIKLDDRTRRLLKSAQKLEFVIEPYGRPVRLAYSMAGYEPLMSKLDKPKPKPKPKPKAKPKAKPKPLAKPKPAPNKPRICYVRPPQAFKSQVASIAYPCDDTSKKLAAQTEVENGVKREKHKRAQAIQKKKLAYQEKIEDTRREEAEWDKKQSKLWISRCQRHWAKGSSPCFCKNYLDQAPPGVTNTCNK